MHFFSNAQTPKPDFAFPKKVDKKAQADLAAAKKAGNAHAALNALIRAYVSNSLIDPESAPKSIQLVEATMADLKNNDIAGLYYALLATMYSNIYNGEQWKYDRRELPLTPLPADITEWSGEQFKHKISELCKLSVENPERFETMPLADYADIVTADDLTLAYYPTLLDFVCSNAFNMRNSVNVREYAELGLSQATARGCIPAEIQWYSRLYDKKEDLKKEYLRLKDNEYSGLLLAKYFNVEYYNSKDVDFKREMCILIRDFLAAHPKAPMASNLTNILNDLLSQQVSVTAPELFSPYAPLKARLTTSNAKYFFISVYPIANPNASLKAIRQQIASTNPLWKKEFDLNRELPFNDTINVELPILEPGYYAIVPKIPGHDDVDYISLARSIPAYTVTIRGESNNKLVLTNPLDGKPIAGAKIEYKGARIEKYAFKATTDADGVVVIDPKYDVDKLKITIDGKTYDYNNCYISTRNEEKTYTELYANVLTDRQLYHPGDSLSALVVAYSIENGSKAKDSRKLLANSEIEIRLRNANYEIVETRKCTTDEFGRACLSFKLPKDGLTGQYEISVKASESLRTFGEKRVMVSDYRLPEFEIAVQSVERNTPSKDMTTIKGFAKYYSGMPLADATITSEVTKSSFIRWYNADNHAILSKEITTDADGMFSITFSKQELSPDYSLNFELDEDVIADEEEYVDKQGSVYRATFSAVSPTGSTAETDAYFTFGKPCSITVSSPSGKIDGQKPLRPVTQVVNAQGENVDIPLEWAILQQDTTIMSGKIGEDIDISSLKPDNYDFKVSPVDKSLAEAAKSSFTVYNTSTDIVPSSDALWMLQDNITLDGSTRVEALIGTPFDSITAYCFVNDDKIGDIKPLTITKGYHKIAIDLPAGFENGLLHVFCVNDCDFTHVRCELKKAPAKGLRIVGETFRDKLAPGSLETWKIRVERPDAEPSQAALALDMRNRSLDALLAGSFSMGFINPSNSHYCRLYDMSNYSLTNSTSISPKRLEEDRLLFPSFNFYGYGIGQSVYDLRHMRVTKSLSNSIDCCYEEDALCARPAPAGSATFVDRAELEEDEWDSEPAEAKTESAPQQAAFAYRDSETPIAVWAPELTTDSQGNVFYSFTVPNANASWRLEAVAWTKDLECGNLLRDFVASKPIMVQPNAPRFMRAGDKAVISIALLNNSDTACVATTTVEFFDPITGDVFDTQEFVCDVEAMGHATVGAELSANVSQSAIGFRVKASNGTFADGEQSFIPVLPSMASLIETTPFYLNPGEDKFEMTLPDEPNARISLTFCENPAWTIVSAIPGLRELDKSYANSAAAAIFSASVARGIVKDNPAIAEAIKAWLENPQDSALVSMLEKNQDLKIAVLNATPWVRSAKAQTDRMANLALIFNNNANSQAIDQAVASLKKLQRSSGGWAWGEWCDKPSLWVTLNVLSMMYELDRIGWMPADADLKEMINKALAYADSEVEGEDMTYSAIRPHFKSTPISQNGQKAISKTIALIKKDWKHTFSPSYKALMAEVLWANGQEALAGQLMASISEFGVWSKDQGLKFPSVNSIFDYAMLLDAYGMILPGSREVDGLRQQLIVRKQANDWGSAVVTSEVVSSILTTGSKWTTAETLGAKAEITAGGATIAPDGPIAKATGSLRADLSSHVGQQLVITSPSAGPAYGAVYAQFERQMAQVEASACDDLSIEKVMMRRASTGWEAVGNSVRVGDRIKVQLTIHCQRPMQYVSIVDERPACFEPVDQLPGWLYAEGAAFYRENRDSSTTMHIAYLSRGTYLLTYEMNVNNAGEFSSGVATIQSQFAPELSAHSAGTMLNSLEKIQ